MGSSPMQAAPQQPRRRPICPWLKSPVHCLPSACWICLVEPTRQFAVRVNVFAVLVNVQLWRCEPCWAMQTERIFGRAVFDQLYQQISNPNPEKMVPFCMNSAMVVHCCGPAWLAMRPMPNSRLWHLHIVSNIIDDMIYKIVIDDMIYEIEYHDDTAPCNPILISTLHTLSFLPNWLSVSALDRAKPFMFRQIGYHSQTRCLMDSSRIECNPHVGCPDNNTRNQYRSWYCPSIFLESKVGLLCDSHYFCG